MAYQSWSVVYEEQPSASKWNILGTNDASFNDGTGIDNGAITSEKLSATVAFRVLVTGTTGNLVYSGSSLSYSEVFDTGSNVASGVFTAPYDGIYYFSVSGGTTDMTGRFVARIVASGSTIVNAFTDGASSNRDPVVSASTITELVAGDTVSVNFGSETASVSLTAPCPFTGFLVGRT